MDLNYLLSYFKKYQQESIIAPLFKMLESMFDLLVPLVVAGIINTGIANRDSGYILGQCGVLILMALLGLACSFTAQYFAARAAIGTATGLRRQLMAHIQKLSFTELDSIGVSTLITRMTSDVNQVQNGVNMFLRLFLRSPFIVIGAMIMAFTIDVQTAGVFALANYMSQILVELVKLANLIVLLTRAVASMGRVATVLDAKPSMVYPQQAACADAADEAVAFDRVSLAYKGAGDESISGVSFRAMRGQTIGVIGGTGSGKSMLVNLIPRFYDATKVSIRLMGRSIEDWPHDELRDRGAVVMQRAQLFKGTIRSNLLYGDAKASDAELWAALEMAQAADFVREKPGQLDEPVEQGGRNFSGGQKQRLTIARALVSKPDILILDDSASALDYATDAALRKALRALPEDTTTFIVSQRTSSIRHADQILVMEDGELVRCGTHDELMAACPVYAEIHESQFRKGDQQA